MQIENKTLYTITFNSDDILELLWNNGNEVPEMEQHSGRFTVQNDVAGKPHKVTFTYKAKGGL